MSEIHNYPYRFHIGTQKAGTTYFYNLLKEHEQIALSYKTEVNFFDFAYDSGFGYYRSLFPKRINTVDISPKHFILAESVAPKIKEYAKKYLKEKPLFLLMLRNPIDYLNSCYAMQRIQDPKLGSTDKSKYSLIEYIRKNPGYLKRAKYYAHLKTWFENFDPEQFKIVCFEDFISEEDKYMEDILEFWGLETKMLRSSKVSKNKLLRYAWLHKVRGVVSKNESLKNCLKNSKIFNFVFDKFLTRKSGNSLSVEDRLEISELLGSDVTDLKKLLNRNFDKWKDFN